MKPKFTQLCVVTFILFLLPVVSCKKDKKDSVDTVVVVPGVSLTTEKDSFSPLELVQVPLKEITVDKAESSAELNGKTFKISVLDNTAFFLVPDVAAGDYTIKFNVSDKLFSLSLKVLPAPTVNQPAVYAASIEAGIDTSVLNLQQYADNIDLSTELRSTAKADGLKYASLLNDYKQQYEKLSTAEKQEFAKVIAANIGWINEIKQAIAEAKTKPFIAPPAKQKTNSTAIADYEAAQSAAIKNWYKSSYVLLRNITKLAGIIYVMPITGAIPFIGTIASGIALGYMITEVLTSLSENLTLLAAVIDTAFMPYQNLSIGDFTTDVYKSGQEKVYGVRASFRKLITGDVSNPGFGETVQNFISRYNDFKTSVSELLQKVPSKFKPNISIAGFKSNIQSITRSINNKYIAVSNVTNAKVKLALTKLSDGTLNFAATTTATTDQSFTYDVTYSNPEISSTGLKKTINAIVKAEVDSTAIYTKACVGVWTVRGFDPNNPPSTYTLDLSADGKGVYHIPGNPQTYPTSWYISKSGNEYRFYEAGFWHPAYNNLTREKLSYPLKPFKVYGNFDPNFVVQIYSKN